MFRRGFLPVVVLAACTSLHADVTMRMAADSRINMALSQSVPLLRSDEALTRIKGSRVRTDLAQIVMLTDVSRDQVTLIDPKTQRYSKMDLAHYIAIFVNPNAFPGLIGEPPNPTFQTESRDTGRSGRIGGIDVFEREKVIHVVIPLFQFVGLALDNVQVRLNIRCWLPKPAEFERVPALRELAAYYAHSKGLSSAAAMMRQLFATTQGVSGYADKLAGEVTRSGDVMLGMQMGVFVPGEAKHYGDMPFAEMNFELKEFVADTLPEDLFAIPAGYKETYAVYPLAGAAADINGARQ